MIKQVTCILAAVLLLTACAANPETPASIAPLMPTQRDMASEAENRGDWAAAARHWAAVYQNAPNDRAITLSFARTLRLSGSCGPASTYIGRWLATAPADADALLELSKCHLVSGRPEAAEKVLSKVLALSPNSWEMETTLAITLDRLGRHDDALPHHDRALELAPEKPIVMSNKALSLTLAGKLAQGLELMRDAASIPGAPAKVRINLAVLEAMTGSPDRAATVASQEMIEAKTESIDMLRRIARSAKTPEPR